jgi:galactonate dehydratase
VVSPIGYMASCHVCAAVPNFLVIEWHWITRLQAWKDFVKEGEIIQKGFVTIPERAGIGVEMNDAAARKLLMPGSKWFDA